MSKKNKRHKSLMKSWPIDEECGVSPESLIYPLKKIINEGYRIERLPVSQFTYTGYNTGKTEQLYFPTPEERFSVRWLSNESKFNRTLLDNVLITAFHLGMEQGRRLNKYNKYDNSLLINVINARTKTIKELKRKLSVHDDSFREIDFPTETNNDELLIDEIIQDLENVDAQNSKEE